MFVFVYAGNEDVINVAEDKNETMTHLIHEPLAAFLKPKGMQKFV